MPAGDSHGDGPDDLIAGRYRLGPVLGRGASAVVHRALDERTGDAVAVKLFPRGATWQDLRQQRREMRALARLRHPGLVALHDGGVADGRPFVVTDLVEGPTLAERITSGPLDPQEVCRLGARLAQALAHVHGAGIVHRDVKPANVLLGAGQEPRLADFGIARAMEGTACTMTATGCVVGTAAYLAPEQVRGEPVGPAADVYALGLVLLEALKGRREYSGSAVESAVARLHRSPVIPPELPGGLAAVLRTLTDTDPARRPSAASAALALATPTMRAHRPVGRARRPVPRLAAAAVSAAALMLSLLAGAIALPSDPTPGAAAPMTAVPSATGTGDPDRAAADPSPTGVPAAPPPEQRAAVRPVAAPERTTQPPAPEPLRQGDENPGAGGGDGTDGRATEESGSDGPGRGSAQGRSEGGGRPDDAGRGGGNGGAAAGGKGRRGA